MFNTYILESDGLFDFKRQLRLKLILFIELSIDTFTVKIDLIVWIRQHLPVNLLTRPNNPAQLFREMPGRVLGLDHHEVVGLKVDLEYEYEAHLPLGREYLDRVLHQHVFLRFLLSRLFRVRTHSLNDHLHFKLVDWVLLAGVHDSEEDAELLTSANLAEGGVVVQGGVGFDAVVSDIVGVF